ncbi:MAG: gliding motility protein GldC [Chitinophagaceae bacterium]
MTKSTIHIDIQLDKDKVAEEIHWVASDSAADMNQRAKAMMLSFWDGADKSALRIDLWTKDMMVDEMGDFFYQSLMAMAETYKRATRDSELMEEIRQFAGAFYTKFRKQQLEKNKA